ncbi:hypothetical protein GQ600_4576 [Phytophthora cactorum]|nr:hypothetical protein GQ600_4576 [Phytophthora cactorum]
MLGQQRHGLLPSTLEMILFLRENRSYWDASTVYGLNKGMWKYTDIDHHNSIFLRYSIDITYFQTDAKGNALCMLVAFVY